MSTDLPGCDHCGGAGRVADAITTGGLLCLFCEGTGSHAAMRLVRAYRLGFHDGVGAVRSALPIHEGEPRGLTELWAYCNEPAGEAALERAVLRGNGPGRIGDGGGDGSDDDG